MLDLKLIRSEPDYIIERLTCRRFPNARKSILRILELDSERRLLETHMNELRAFIRRKSKEIGKQKIAERERVNQQQN